MNLVSRNGNIWTNERAGSGAICHGNGFWTRSKEKNFEICHFNKQTHYQHVWYVRARKVFEGCRVRHTRACRTS